MTPWWRRLGRYGRPYLRAIGAVTVLTAVTVGLDVLKPWPLKLLVDHVVADEPLPAAVSWIERLPGAGTPTGLVAWLSIGTVTLFAVAAAALVVQRYVLSGVGTRMTARLAEDLFAHLQTMPLSYHRRSHAGDLIRRVTEDTDSAHQLIASVVVPLASALMSLALMAVIMFRLDPVLAVVALSMAVPMGVAIHVFAKPITERAFDQYELEGQMMALAEQTLTALPVVQSFGREQHGQDEFRSLSSRTVGAYLRRTVSELQFTMTSGGIVAAGTSLVMLVGGFRAIDGRVSLGSLLVFLSYLVAIYAPLETLAQIGSAHAGAAAGARRVLAVLDTANDVADRPGAVPLPGRAAGAVRVHDVSFGYERDRRAVRDVTLSVEPGQVLAIVGETGSGKSTLLSLLLRAADPWSGRVLLDGVDVRTLQIESLRAQISVVLQDPYLLPVSVADNIAYGRPDATRDEVMEAAVAAQADQFIRHLPGTYDAIIGERGATLSGGQRQRIAIARAMLKDAPVLLLDEPTAAVDAETETGLLDALEPLMRARTTIIVTHRLSLIRTADVVAVMGGGRIVELGPPSDLLTAGGELARLVELQSGDELLPARQMDLRSEAMRGLR
jgi:ATP-binding cassette, subfamily B, bacterial